MQIHKNSEINERIQNITPPGGGIYALICCHCSVYRDFLVPAILQKSFTPNHFLHHKIFPGNICEKQDSSHGCFFENVSIFVLKKTVATSKLQKVESLVENHRPGFF